MDTAVYKAPPLAFSWTGIYAGGHGGAGWAQMDWVFDSLSSSVSGPLPEGRHTARGALAGGQIGYNYQIGALVWGLEGEASWAKLRGDNIHTIYPGDVPPFGIQDITRVDALGTIAGRVGVAWDRTLLYGKASGAYAIDNYEVIDNFLRLQFPFPVLVESTSATGGERRWGWMVGVGVERLSSITDR